MREAFVEIAKLMHVKLIIIDEANLLVITKRTRRPTDYVESLRRLGDRIGCAVLLLGTIDMLELMGFSGQVNRRTLKVHLNRLCCDDDEGKDEFASLLSTLEEDFGLTKDLLTSHAAQLYLFTYGIPGEVVYLIEYADTFREALGAETIGWEHLEMARHHPTEIVQMRWEADIIEAVMTGRELSQTDKQEIERRRRVRMKARRIPVGMPE
jgi:hypothetical protein